MTDLRNRAQDLDGRPYPAYRALRDAAFDVGVGTLVVEHVQPDPFAPPSRLRVTIVAAGLADAARSSPTARRACADHLHRRVRDALAARREPALTIAEIGQQVLERTAVTVSAAGDVTVRLAVALPAAGRRIRGDVAARVLAETVPQVLREAVVGHDPATLARHVAAVEDQVALRGQLATRGLVAFVADGSVLPRRSGVDDRPISGGLPLRAPDALAQTLVAPHAGPLRGLAIPAGVVAIVGGGYHGKSTLLAALAAGVYDHVPGDGRDRCVTRTTAVTIRAEDGRSIRGVDLRPFIDRLPLGRSTARFDTDDASGSTSQAAAVMEALEAGADTLLIDEDTAAANFMVRDARMRGLIAVDDEPITPYVDRVRQLADDHGVSTVLVVGGTGDWLDVADVVVQMRGFQPYDVTARARAVAAAHPLRAAAPRAPNPWPALVPRMVGAADLDARDHRGRVRARARGRDAIEFGAHAIALGALAQLVEAGQCRLLADLLEWTGGSVADGARSVAEVLDDFERVLERDGIGAFSRATHGDRSAVRRFELAAVLNRHRGLRPTGER